MVALRVCFVGDSITNGTGDREFLGWPGRVCRAGVAAGHDLTCYNLGVRADTSALIRARWEGECRVRLPEGVNGRLVFGFGVNDTAEEVGKGVRVPLGASLANAEIVLTQAQAWKPTLWIGPAPIVEPKQPLRPYPGLAYDFRNARIAEANAAFAALADKIGVPYLDVFGPLSSSEAWSHHVDAGDGVHPVAEGYVAFARLVETWPAWQAWLA
jgi:lysophospholipase L1-like esterase